MNKKRYTFIFLSILMTAWRIGRNAYNAQVEKNVTIDHNHTDSTSIGMESWNVYLPPYEIEQYSNFTTVGEMLLFVMPASYVDESLLFIWNQFITYNVHYEWDMYVSIPVWQDIRTIKLILSSENIVLVRTVLNDDEHLVISIWFHPRTYVSIVRFIIKFSIHRHNFISIAYTYFAFLF